GVERVAQRNLEADYTEPYSRANTVPKCRSPRQLRTNVGRIKHEDRIDCGQIHFAKRYIESADKEFILLPGIAFTRSYGDCFQLRAHSGESRSQRNRDRSEARTFSRMVLLDGSGQFFSGLSSAFHLRRDQFADSDREPAEDVQGIEWIG